eukprot:Skav205519  [mRNA]  locus=scaffold231:317105:317383:- [translate_table: standard]
MLQLLLVRSVREREDKPTSLAQSDPDPGNCNGWFGRKQCCTMKCGGKQPYQQRTLLEGAQLHNCRLQKGPYKLAGGCRHLRRWTPSSSAQYV